MEVVSGDGAGWIDERLAEYAPRASRCVDPFHVVQWAGKALDGMRQESRRALHGEARHFKACAGKERDASLGREPWDTGRRTKEIKGALFPLGKGPGT